MPAGDKCTRRNRINDTGGGVTMIVKEAQVLYDARGKKTHVVLPIKKYQEILELLDDAEDIRAIKEVEHQKTIPWSEVKKKLHKKT